MEANNYTELEVRLYIADRTIMEQRLEIRKLESEIKRLKDILWGKEQP